MKKPLQFIDLRDQNKNATSIAIYGNRDNGRLVITGGLSHGTEVEPASQEDADRFIKWLQEWKIRNLP